MGLDSPKVQILFILPYSAVNKNSESSVFLIVLFKSFVVAQGIFMSVLKIGSLTPSAEAVAEAITKRDRIQTVPTGSYALNTLGLSTQVPMNIVPT